MYRLKKEKKGSEESVMMMVKWSIQRMFPRHYSKSWYAIQREREREREMERTALDCRE